MAPLWAGGAAGLLTKQVVDGGAQISGEETLQLSLTMYNKGLNFARPLQELFS